jgi:hypothetical protein
VFLNCLVNFLDGIGQTVRVDIDANAAAGTAHVLARFQSPYALFSSWPHLGH